MDKTHSFKGKEMLFRVFTIICFILLAFNSHADQIIEFGNIGSKLSYKTGSINKETYNGFAADISLFDNETLFGNIKTLKIDSQKMPNGKNNINLLSIKDLTLFPDEFGIQINLEKFEITDIGQEIFEYFNNVMEGDSSPEVPNYNIEEHKNFSFNLSGLKFEGDDLNLEISSMSFPKVKYGTLSSGQEFAKESTFEMNGFSFVPNPENIEMLPLSIILASIGQQSLKLDLFGEATVEDKGLLLDMFSNFEFNMSGAALLKISLNYLVPIETYNYFYNNSSLIEEMQNQNFESLDSINNEILMELGKIQLSKINIQIEDLGVRKPLLIMYASSVGASEEEALSFINMTIQGLFSQFIPANADKFSEIISQFLIEGGEIELTVSPPNPLPLISAAGLFVMPDLAIESLGVKLQTR